VSKLAPTELSFIIQGFKRVTIFLTKSQKRQIIFTVLLIICAGVLTNMPALILGRLTDQLIKNNNFDFTAALPFLGLIAVVIIFREAINVLRKFIVENIATSAEKEQTVRTISRVLRADESQIKTYKIGALHGKISRSVQGFVRLFKLTFLDFLPVSITAAAALIIALTQKPLLAGLMALVIPTGLFIVFKQISSQKGIRVNLLRGKEHIDGAVVEVMSGLETVRALDTIKFETSRVDDIAESLRVKEIKHHIQMAFYDAGKYLNEGFFYILVISISIIFAANGAISQGDVLTYSILFLSILQPLRDIHRILDEAHESSILTNDLYELQNLPVDPSFTAKAYTQNIPVNKDIISVKNLSFTYKNQPVLRNISLEIKKGEHLGIVGSSGSGKSTFIKLMLRLHHNYEGEISIIGNDLHALDRKTLAKMIAYVPQKPYVFSGSIRDNLTYGISHTISDDELVKVSKLAAIYDEIETMGGFNAVVHEQGSNLSGGQRQRIALARVMLRKPQLIIFDEATSALDNENEALIQKNLEKIFAKTAIITIAHRLTTLRNSDRIIVFENGKIIQSGDYQTLSSEVGRFRDFLSSN